MRDLDPPRRRRLFLAVLGMALALGQLASPALAWSPQTQVAIAERAARIAPPDLARQIDRHRDQLRRGVLAPDPGGGDLEGRVEAQMERAVREIREHLPFSEVVFRLGRIARMAAAANDPLASGANAHAADYRLYVDSAWSRFNPVFYPDGRGLRAEDDVRRLVRAARQRARAYSPSIEEEYRRIGGGRGLDRFDDRSTAFGVAAVSFSHAVSDAAALFRHVWLEAGGADPRPLSLTPPTESDRSR